jgi:hypothetical protein
LVGEHSANPKTTTAGAAPMPMPPAVALTRLSLLVALAWASHLGAAHAEATPYFIGLSQGITYERNVLRLADDVAAPEGLKRSDTIFVTALQGGIDQPFGRQRAYGNLSLRQVTYASNTAYNNQAYTGNVGLDWSTIERISGSLSANANRSLSSFGSFGIGLLREKNFEDSQGFNASVSMGLVTEYSAEAGFGHRQVRNSLKKAGVLARDFDQDSATVGLRWRPSTAANLGLSLRETRGRYPKFRQVADGSFLADRFKQQGLEISGSIQPMGVSSFDLRLGQNKTKYDLNQSRDFSGITGSLGWTWQPTGKLRITSRVSRDTGQDSFALVQFNVPGISEYSRVNDVFRLQADLEVSAKIALTASWQTLQRNLTQNTPSPVDGSVTSASGRDTTHQLNLGGRWTPYRTTLLSCDVGAERRSASGPLAEPLRDYTINCYGQFQLQL